MEMSCLNTPDNTHSATDFNSLARRAAEMNAKWQAEHRAGQTDRRSLSSLEAVRIVLSKLTDEELTRTAEGLPGSRVIGAAGVLSMEGRLTQMEAIELFVLLAKIA
jgi:hypothetical protein